MKNPRFPRTFLAISSLLLLLAIPVSLPAQDQVAPSCSVSPVEPGAGSWKTWVLASGGEVAPLPPPGVGDTAAEIRQLKEAAAARDDAALAKIRYWDAGPPSNRWIEIALAQIRQKSISTPKNTRTMSLLNVAIYDATISAWRAKYFYNRQRPSEVDPQLAAAVKVPASPSYPSEHAVVAGAAAQILSYVYPADAQTFQSKAQEDGDSRVLAGVQYPSDVAAGLDLGRQVADLVIERAKADGSDAVWTGTVPQGPGLWNGTNPIEPLAGTWKTWVLESGSELRPGPPPAYDSEREAADLAEIKTFPRAFASNSRAFYWQTFDGIQSDWYVIATRRIFEYHLDENQPRAARIYAFLSVAHHDAVLAVWDAKFTYWAIRPFQLDPSVTTLFPTPNHPSYPAAHGAASGSISEALAYAFPREAEASRALGTEAGTSRIWAGIHFRRDVEVGLALGRAVAQRVIARVQNDGSQ